MDSIQKGDVVKNKNDTGNLIKNKKGVTDEWDEFLSLYQKRNEKFNNDYKLHSRFHRRSKSGWRSFVRMVIGSLESFFVNESFIGIRYLKLVSWDFSIIICDLLCGLAEAALSIPQGLSYSSLANVLPSMGLCNGILQPIIYLFIGSSLYVSIGVNSVESIVAGSAVDSLIGSGAPQEVRSELCSLVIFFHGVSCCLLRIFGLAHFVDFLSDSVLQGFLSGVAFSIIVKELPFMFAIEPPQINCVPIRALFVIINNLSNISWQATLFSISTIFFLESIVWIKVYMNTNFPIPSQLIIIIIANIASAFISPDIPMIGLIPRSSLLVPNNLTWYPPEEYIQPSTLDSLPFFTRVWISALPLTFISFFAHYSTAQSMEIRSQKNLYMSGSKELTIPASVNYKEEKLDLNKQTFKETNSSEKIYSEDLESLEELKSGVCSKVALELKNITSPNLHRCNSSELNYFERSTNTYLFQEKSGPKIHNIVNEKSIGQPQGDIESNNELGIFSDTDISVNASPNREINMSLSIVLDTENHSYSFKTKLNKTYGSKTFENEQILKEEIGVLERENCIDAECIENYSGDINDNTVSMEAMRNSSLETAETTTKDMDRKENNNVIKKKYFATRSLFSVGTEILVLGIVNIVGSFFNCLPGAASLARTNLNFTLGVRSPLHNVAYSMGVLLVAMFLLEYIRFLPEAVLGAIITQAMIRMVNINYLIELIRMKSIDSFFWVIAFVGTTTAGINYGIIFALASSITYLIKFLYRPKFEVLGRLPGTLLFKSVDKFPQAVQLPYVRIVRFEGPLTFINAERFVKNLETLIEVWLEDEDLSNCEKLGSEDSYDCISKNQYFPNITNSINFGERIPTIIQDLNENHVERIIIIDACMINEIDYTALQILQRFNYHAKKLSFQIWFASFSHPNSGFLLRSGFYDIIPLVHCFVDLSEAVAAAQICIGKRYHQTGKSVF
ncbi:high affinity sulfate transporter-related [Cryptosporidium ryanae]|uniref:high affinity sulfate transporter-related n=1 Tax=Cryptosporidium ryanae TaxID=515981 RepID=UPI003519F3AA|nr:high affinity sulfate transporter-related [Cryptosporidium ryanae]